MVIHQEFRNERAAAAGIAILTVFKAKIFLGKRLESEFREPHPGRGELSTCLPNFKAQSPDGQRVGGRAPAQINVDCSPYRLIFDAIFIPVAVLGRDLQLGLTRRIADGDIGCPCVK